VELIDTLTPPDLAARLDRIRSSLAIEGPGGRPLLTPADGRPQAVLRLHGAGAMLHLATGQIGRLAEDHVEGRVDVDGSMRVLMDAAAALLDHDPREPSRPTAWRLPRWLGLHGWPDWIGTLRSSHHHTPEADVRQVQRHYDVSDDFYALWLDPLRVYSCAVFRRLDPSRPADAEELAQAQRDKLDLVCRKLRLQPGERFLDIGAGWGGLLLWAAEHYGVEAHGITLSRHQHAHVRRRIRERGLSGRVSVALMDYRDLPAAPAFDKIASVGMFEHVGRARLPAYFATLQRLLRPGGLLLNHGITAGGTRHDQLGAGIGDFIERHVFPGGELLHVSHVLQVMAEAGLEGLDVENLRPHYARTLWAWSDALEARLDEAARLVPDRVLRAYRLYLPGSAMAFERGWMALHQVLASRPSGDLNDGPMRGAQCDYPFNRAYMLGAGRGGPTPPTTSASGSAAPAPAGSGRGPGRCRCRAAGA
jgi:cyclopropane-fatty-acyl-phospholipid synthase